jgi:hypothetical protein
LSENFIYYFEIVSHAVTPYTRRTLSMVLFYHIMWAFCFIAPYLFGDARFPESTKMRIGVGIVYNQGVVQFSPHLVVLLAVEQTTIAVIKHSRPPLSFPLYSPATARQVHA